MRDHIGLRLDPQQAATWVRASLGEGSILARLMLERLTALPRAWLLAPETVDALGTTLDNASRGIRQAHADVVVADAIQQLAGRGLKTLIVESDLARRGDPDLGTVAFAGDHVLRWAEWNGDPSPMTRLLRTGASGYPTNAFGCTRSAADLGVGVGHELGPTNLARIVQVTCALLVSVYDGEAYILMSDLDGPE